MGNRDVVIERIGWVIGGAYHLHAEFFENSMHTEVWLGESRIATCPDRICSLRAEKFVNAEVTAQFHVNPVMHRVAQGLGHGLGPGLEFFTRRRITCDQSLCNAVGAHQSPLVVVAAQP